MRNSGRGIHEQSMWRDAERVFRDSKRFSGSGCLLPSIYSEFTFDCLMKWLFDEVMTWNEAERASMRVPYKGYLEDYGWMWFESVRTGSALIVEKSRRLVISWCTAAFECWDLMRRPGDRILCDQHYGDAQEQVWRLYHIYSQCRMRNLDWGLGESTTYGSLPIRKLDALSLPNGSIMTANNHDPEGLRGSGIAGIRIEECGSCRNLNELRSQAKIICQGSPGSIGGHVVLIGNCSTEREWEELLRDRRN